VSTAHRPVKFPAKCHIPWEYCRKCGLLYLKNDVTRKAIKAPCPSDDVDDEAPTQPQVRR